MTTPTPRAGAAPRSARTSGGARRDQLTAIAAGLFARDGYHNVTVGDIAAAAGLSGPAIYRHFPGKQAILAEVVRSGFDEMAQVLAADLAGTSDPAERLRRTYRDLAAFVIRRPEFGVMWRREYRHLAPEDAAELAKRMGEASDAAVAELRLLRPQLEAADTELVSWAAMSVMGSISDHRVRLPRAAFEELLAAIAMDVVAVEFDEGGADNRPHEPAAQDRKEQILAAAARLFRDRGYHEVTLDEIGAAAGIAGPSVYSHFAGKAELLRTITERIGERLRQDLAASEAAMAGGAARESAADTASAVDPGRAAAAPNAGAVVGSDPAPAAGAARESAAAAAEPDSATEQPAADRLAGTAADPARAAVAANAGAAVGSDPVLVAGAVIGSDPVLVADAAIGSDLAAAVGAARESAAADPARVAAAATTAATATTPTPTAALTDLATRYVTTVLTSRDLVAAYFTEGHNLPDRDRAETRRFQRAYAAHWAALLASSDPAASPEEIRIRVLAAFAVVNDTVRTRRLLERPGLAGRLRALMVAVLLTPTSGARDVNRR
jgi:AcrR family transcriptional regulator